MDPYHAHAVLYRLLVRVDVHQLARDAHVATAQPGLARHHHLLQRAVSRGVKGQRSEGCCEARARTRNDSLGVPSPPHLEGFEVTEGSECVEVEV